jgi:Zn/Cd-binding protein ZinT
VGATLITRSQSFQDTVKTAGAALTEMVDLQQKIATKYSFPQEQVGIRENVQVTGSGRSQTLQIILENTSLNALSDADREKEANKIANYARGEYRRIGSVDQICVITLVKQQVAVFSSSQARSYCYSSKP